MIRSGLCLAALLSVGAQERGRGTEEAEQRRGDIALGHASTISIHGQVVAAEGDLGRAVVKAQLRSSAEPGGIEFADGGLLPPNGEFAFRYEHDPESPECSAMFLLRLGAFDEESGTGLYLEQDVGIRSALELGTLRLQGLRTLKVRVLDGSGVGIEGARAYAGLQREFDGSDSDRDGYAWVSVPAGTRRAFVLARGYALGRIDLDDDLPSVTLEPAAILEVECATPGTEVLFSPAGPLPEHLFRGSPYLFHSPGDDNIDWRRSALGTGAWSRTDENGRRIGIACNEQGRIVLYDVAWEVPMRMRIEPEGGTARETVVRIDKAQRLSVRL